MTRLECVVARAYQPRSRIRVSFHLFLSPVLSRRRVTTDFYAVGEIKKCAYSCSKLLRERYTFLVDWKRLRARVALFPSFARLSRVSPNGSSLVITGVAATRLHYRSCRRVNMPRYSAIRYLSLPRKAPSLAITNRVSPVASYKATVDD